MNINFLFNENVYNIYIMHYLNIQVAFCPQTSEIMTKCASGDLGIKSEQFSHTFADKVRIVYFLPPDNERGGGVLFIPSVLKTFAEK